MTRKGTWVKSCSTEICLFDTFLAPQHKFWPCSKKQNLLYLLVVKIYRATIFESAKSYISHANIDSGGGKELSLNNITFPYYKINKLEISLSGVKASTKLLIQNNSNNMKNKILKSILYSYTTNKSKHCSSDQYCRLTHYFW